MEVKPVPFGPRNMFCLFEKQSKWNRYSFAPPISVFRWNGKRWRNYENRDDFCGAR